MQWYQDWKPGSYCPRGNPQHSDFIFKIYFKECLLLLTKQLDKSVVVHHAKSCLTRCDPMDCSLPGSSLHGILQARTLEWVGCHFLLQGSSWPRNWTWVSCVSCTAGGFFTLWAIGNPDEAGMADPNCQEETVLLLHPAGEVDCNWAKEVHLIVLPTCPRVWSIKNCLNPQKTGSSRPPFL